MTCDEFRRLVFDPPADATRGLRLAVIGHSIQCPACEEFLFQEGMKVLQRITPEQASETEAAARRVHEADVADPEGRAMVDAAIANRFSPR